MTTRTPISDHEPTVVELPNARLERNRRAGGVTRRRILGAGLVAGATAAAAHTPTADAAGAGATGTAMEFVGQINQEGTRLEVAVYLTARDGATDEDLFTRPRGRRFDDLESWTAATARLTLYGVVEQSSVSVVGGNVVVARAAGEIGLYHLPEGGATFERPASFAGGRKIARYTGTFQNRLIVGPPAAGIATLAGDLRRLGRGGPTLRLDAGGRAELLDPAGPSSRLYVAGTLTRSGTGRR
jgi:hypothetical protein